MTRRRITILLLACNTRALRITRRQAGAAAALGLAGPARAVEEVRSPRPLAYRILKGDPPLMQPYEQRAAPKLLKSLADGADAVLLGVKRNDPEDYALAADLASKLASAAKRPVAVGLDVSNREDKKLLRAKKGPFGSTLVFKDGGEIARRFGEAASSVGAIVDTVVLADAAYYVGYAGLSTFDRTLVDIRATRDQYAARLARPDNCTFTVGKNKQRGVADHVPNAPAGRVYMRHFRSLP